MRCTPYNKIRLKNSAGFTLIELMISVSIIGILLSLSIPTYLDYAIRAKISEAIHIAVAAKVSISEFYISNGKFPSSMESAGIRAISTDYISSLSYESDSDAEGDDSSSESGRIVITLSQEIGAEAAGKKLMIEGQAQDNGLITWKCRPNSTDSIPAHLLPSSCRGS